jgi:branched-chain amino acid aminotransferase
VKAWVNKTLIDFHDVLVHPLSHSFSRASAIFEVMEIVPTERGPAFFCLQEHLQRFFDSARATFMELPITPDELEQALSLTAKINRVHRGIAKIFAYYPDIGLGTLPSSKRIDVAVFCLGYEAMGIKPEDLGQPVTAAISTFRKIDPQTTAVHAKVVGNYVNGFLAKSEVRASGYDEAILLDTHGFIAEGPNANIFFVRGACIETPTTESVLPGITRSILIQVLSDMDYAVHESHILPDDLASFDEAFFSGTLNHVQPISSLTGRALVCPGAVTVAVRERMRDVLGGREPRYEKHLRLIS